MPQLRQDNRFKWVIRDRLLDYLYTPYMERKNAILRRLIERNCKLIGKHHLSFAYNGQYYNMDTVPGPPVRQRVHPDLLDEVDQFYREEYATLTIEKTKVHSYLDTVLSQSSYPGDYLPLLPAMLHAAVQQSITCHDWSQTLSQEKIDAFLARHQAGYDLVRTRLAINLIL